MTRDERIEKLKNGSDTAVWAANEIEALRKALKQSYDIRSAFCKNSDDSLIPVDPATWDKTLQCWGKVLGYNQGDKND